MTPTKHKRVTHQANAGIYLNITATVRNRKGEVVRVYKDHNLVADVGLNVLARRLSNDTTYTGIINYGAVGTSTTPPSGSDTQLGTEIYRKIPVSQYVSGAISSVTFFYAEADWNGTAREFGTFIDGTASANTGRLFNKVAVTWVKGADETLTVEVQNTFASAT